VEPPDSGVTLPGSWQNAPAIRYPPRRRGRVVSVSVGPSGERADKGRHAAPRGDRRRRGARQKVRVRNPSFKLMGHTRRYRYGVADLSWGNRRDFQTVPKNVLRSSGRPILKTDHCRVVRLAGWRRRRSRSRWGGRRLVATAGRCREGERKNCSPHCSGHERYTRCLEFGNLRDPSRPV
jgi:hypothetical protein